MKQRRRTHWRWGSAVLAALVVGLLPGSAAGAIAPEEGAPSAQAVVQTFRNQLSGDCLDDTSQGFRTYDCNGTDPQRWHVRELWPNTRELRNVNTGRCMENRPGGQIRTWTCDESGYQKWYIDHWSDGTIRFRNRATGLCLHETAPFGTLAMRTCNTSEMQSWL